MNPLALLAVSIGVPILAASAAPHAVIAATAPAPKAHPVDGATAKMNTPFAVDHFNWRITKVQFIANGQPLVVKMGLPADDGTGTFVMTAAIKNNSSDSWAVPSTKITFIYKDGSTTTEQPVQPYTMAGKPADATYQAGDGGTLYFVIPDCQEPTSDNPITKIVFRQTYDELKPPLIRLLNPPVTVVK
jgi:hypothetical protein